jgi:hypothetical protein
MIKKDANCFKGTEFSKWVFDNCYHNKPQTFNFGFTDGDFMAYKSEQKTLRFIEHKGEYEQWSSDNQKYLFTYHLPNRSKIINENSEFKQEVYVVITKDNPYEGMLIYDCINKKSKFFIEDDVIKFMKFEIDFNQGKDCTTPYWINEQKNNK